MNAFDRLQYYENYYDSFCSEFAIPRASTSHSFTSQPGSSNTANNNNNNLPTTTNQSSRHKHTRKPNHFYYFDSVSDAFSEHDLQLEKSSEQSCENENSIKPVIEPVEIADESRMSSSQPKGKKKGPTPPPKPKPKKASFKHKEPVANFVHSNPELEQMGGMDSNFILNPSGNFDSSQNRSFHHSFESVASFPPPPPKLLKSPNVLHQQQQQPTDMLPSFSFGNEDRQSPLHHQPMSLSDFMKVSSNTGFKSKSWKLGGNGQTGEAAQNGQSSPSPSLSSEGQSRSSGGGGRSSVLTFRKKCGVTKRRKKIDESLFAPNEELLPNPNSNNSPPPPSTRRDSGDHIIITNSQKKPRAGNNNKTNSSLSLPLDNSHAPAAESSSSSKYSITAAGSSSSGVATTFLAETNHDTDFELDPLPEKDCDDYDFTWPTPPASAFQRDDSPAQTRGSPAAAAAGEVEVKKNGHRKGSHNATNGGNERRPSSRCSLIINSLMGHLSGLTKAPSQEAAQQESQQQGQKKKMQQQTQLHDHHHQFRHNNNNNHFTHLDHNHPHHHEVSDRHSVPPKFGIGKLRKKGEQREQSSKKSASATGKKGVAALLSNNHNKSNINMNPDDDDAIGQLNGAHRNSSQKMMTSFPTKHNNNPQHKNGGDDVDEVDHSQVSQWTRMMMTRPRSISAFNLDTTDTIHSVDSTDNDDDDELAIINRMNGLKLRKKSFFYPFRRSGSKSMGNININRQHQHNPRSSHQENDETCLNESFPSLANVIGCIPRVSLSNMKKPSRSSKGRKDDAVLLARTLQPQFAIGSDDAANAHIMDESNISFGNHICEELSGNSRRNAVTGQSSFPQSQQRDETCCGGGLFGAEPLCCDKFDKYYGQYSLTGLNIPNIINDTGCGSSKSAEELVLDRYYAHCNKVVRNKQGGSNNTPHHQGKQQHSGTKGVFRGKRTYSLPEKLWRNVTSLPIINSSCSNSALSSSKLCDHHKAKQIEECHYCVREQQQQQHHHCAQQHLNYRDNGKSGKEKSKKRCEMKTDLFHLEQGRDFLENTAARLIKLKKVGKSCSSKSEKKGKGFQDCGHALLDEGFSSSSFCSSSSSGGGAAAVVSQHLKRKQQKGTTCASSSGCLNSSNSEEFDDSAGTVRQKGKSISCEVFQESLVGEEEELDEVLDDDDDDYVYEGQGQLALKVKASNRSITTVGNKGKDANNPNHPRPRTSGNLPVPTNGRCGVHNGDDEQVREAKHVRGSEQVRKLKSSSTLSACEKIPPPAAMNPIISVHDEDGSSSSTISSLPRSSHGEEEELREQLVEETSSGKKKSSKRNRVKWTFLTSGLAKATRKLSSSSSFISTTDSTSSTKESEPSSSGCGTSSSADKRKAFAKSSKRASFNDTREGNDCEEENDASASCEAQGVNTLKHQRRSGGGGTAGGKGNTEVFLSTTRSTSISTKATANAPSTSSSSHRNPCVKKAHSPSSSPRCAATAAPSRTGSLRRKPSYNTKKRPITIQVMPCSANTSSSTRLSRNKSRLEQQKQQRSLEQADGKEQQQQQLHHRVRNKILQQSSFPKTVFMRKSPLLSLPIALTPRGAGRTVSADVANISSIFSATSTTSSDSTSSSTCRSSSSGYTSNVSKRTSLFLKSFRKRFAKKNNKVADGDEEDAYRSRHDNDDDDDDDDDEDRDNDYHFSNSRHDADDKVQNTHNHNHASPAKTQSSSVGGAGGTLQRKLKRSTSSSSKHAIFSTFYIGPGIRDPVKEEKIYVTKDFDDVTLDLQSGEVKKTGDGTLLFTADPLCFAAKQQKKNKKREMITREKKTKKKRQTKKGKQHQQVTRSASGDVDDDEEAHVVSSGNSKSSKKNNNIISHPPPESISASGALDESHGGVVISGWEQQSPSTNSPPKKSANENNNSRNTPGYMGKKKKKNDSSKTPSGESTIIQTKKSSSASRGGRLIKSYLGISKDLLGKNQSADDVSGEHGVENLPDTPTRSSSSILGRLRESSRSAFGGSSGGNGGASNRSSSKKRSSSKHDTVNTQTGNGSANGGFEVSLTDSPTRKTRNSLSDSVVAARGKTDDANDQGVSGKLSTGHHHHHQHQTSSSEEELASINSCDNRLSSLTLGENGGGGGSSSDGGEYTGPFQGRAEALVDSTPNAYDRHALRYKRGDIIDIISKKPTGLWMGKVNNQIGHFKFINVRLLPNPSTTSEENYDGDNKRRDEVVDDEEDGIDGDDSAGDYADTSNYQCSLHYAPPLDPHSTSLHQAGGARNCSPNDAHHRSPGARQYRGNSKRLGGALTPWEAEEQRRSIANVINGYIISRKEEQEKQRAALYHRDPLGLMNPAERGEEEVDEDDVENEEDDEEDTEEDDEEEEDNEEGNVIGSSGGELQGGEDEQAAQVLNQNHLDQSSKDVKCQKKSGRGGKKKVLGNAEIGDENGSGAGKKKKSSSGKEGRATSVSDLLQRLDLEMYTRGLENHGFETLDLLKGLEKEDLDILGIVNATDRVKILTAVELLKEWDMDADRIPGQTLYQFQYYQTQHKTPKHSGGSSNASGNSTTVGGAKRIIGPSSPGLQQSSHLPQTTNAMIPSPHFYRLHHPRDSGIFVGKVDGEEDGDEPISATDLSCAESHPDAETEEIILSPINLQKTSSVVTTGNPTAPWHHHNNNKQGSHHHINRFISKGPQPPTMIVNPGSPATTALLSSTTPAILSTAQQPTSSASSSGSSSSGIATTGDSFWQSVSSNNSNGSSGGSSSGSGGPGAASIVVDQNHSQWSKHHQQKTSSQQKGKTRDASPAYNSDSVRNRFLQAKSLFEPSSNCSSTTVATASVPTNGIIKPRVPGHVYENDGDEMGVGGGETQHHLHLQRAGSQGKSQQQQQQQNRFLYCEKSSDSGISVCTNSPPPMRNEFRN